MLYLMRDAYDQMLSPMRMAAEMARTACENPFSPLAYTPNGRAVAASCELFERATRTYPKPAFNLPTCERVA